jgi:uncharacterized membrane protein SpoIIM required for sporulation
MFVAKLNNVRKKPMYFTRAFMLTTIFAFILLVSSMYLWANQAYLTATPKAANETRNQVQTERQSSTAMSIFINNLRVSLFLIIPAIGIVPFMIIWYNSAYVVGLLCQASGITPITAVLNLITLGFLEILAYTVLLSENLYIVILALFKKGAKERITTQSWKTFILYVMLLFFAAVVEAILIA